MNKYLLLILFSTLSLLLQAYPIQEIEDSLNHWANFPPIVTPISINNIKIKDKKAIVLTNKTLSGLSLNKEQINGLKSQFKKWLNLKNNYKINIYSDKHELEELVTDRFIKRTNDVYIKRADGHNLSNKKIALWASHGLYYNISEDRWKWQRATVWTTVEDIFSCEFAYWVTQMLKNAGAEVFQPRGQWDDKNALEPGKSGFPRWAEAAKYWLEYKGFPDSLWHHNQPIDSKDTTLDHYKDDIRCRPLWVNFLCGGSKKNPQQDGLKKEIDLCLAIHTDGYSIPSDSATVGTLVIYSETDTKKNKRLADGSTRMLCRDLADYVQNQIVEDIRHTYCPNWGKRQLLNANYFETTNPVIPSIIIEILSHNQMTDMKYGLNPKFRFFISRSIYKGVLRFLQRENGVVQPLPIRDFSILLQPNAKTNMYLSWKPTIDSLEPSAKPDKYILQVRHNNNEKWHDSLTLLHPYAKITASRGRKYDFRVIAMNNGGKSFPSETLSAYLSTQKKDSTSILIINGFNRVEGPEWFADTLHAGIQPGSFAIPHGISYCYIGDQFNFSRSDPWKNDDECGFGMCSRDKATQPIIGNTYDYPALHGEQLAKKNISFSSCNISTLPSINICNYTLLDVILGKEKLKDKEKQNLQFYLDDFLQTDSTKKILMSGCFIGEIPHASHCGNVQNKNQILTFYTLPNEKTIQSENVSAWQVTPNRTVLFRYKDSQLPACVYTNRSILWAVALESFTSFNKAYNHSINYLLKKNEE